MHFGLTGYEYSTIGGTRQLHVHRNEHNLFYLPPGQKDFLLHGRSDHYVTFEVNFRPAYLTKLLNGNRELLGEFYRRLETGDPALLGRESQPIMPKMYQVIRAIWGPLRKRKK